MTQVQIIIFKNIEKNLEVIDLIKPDKISTTLSYLDSIERCYYELNE